MLGRQQVKRWAKRRILADEELKAFLWDRKGFVLLAVIAAFLLLLYGEHLRVMATMAVLSVIGFASLLYNRVLRVSLGFEFILLVTVLAGFTYGPLAAFVVGSAAMLAAEIFNGSFQHSTYVSFVGLAGVALAIPLVADSGITMTGIVATLVYNGILAPGYLLMGSEPWKVTLFVATDILFNVWVFFLIAPRLAGVLA